MVSVRYSMTQDGFSRTSPYVIAEDVSAETVGVISEHASEWPGIETRVAVTRTYGEDGSLAPHVVGYTGVITDTQYQQAVEDGNTYDAEDNISGYKWSDTMAAPAWRPPLRRSCGASGARRLSTPTAPALSPARR